MTTKHRMVFAGSTFTPRPGLRRRCGDRALGPAKRAAKAQGRFGDKGQLAITAENLFEFGTERYGQYGRQRRELAPPSTTWGSCSAVAAPLLRCPQVGGILLHHSRLSRSVRRSVTNRAAERTPRRTATGPSSTNSPPNDSTFVFVPKVGYALMLGQVVGFWFRGGLGYFYDGGSAANQDRHQLLVPVGRCGSGREPFPALGLLCGPAVRPQLYGIAHRDERPWALGFRGTRPSATSGVGVGVIGYVDL